LQLVAAGGESKVGKVGARIRADLLLVEDEEIDVVQTGKPRRK
jgi:hypothetical protein